MIEENSNAHRHALSRVSLNAEMLRWSTSVNYESFCKIPPEPLYESSDAYNSDSEDDHDMNLVQDPLTSDFLEKHHATRTLLCYVDRLALSNRISRCTDFLEYARSQNTGCVEWFCTVRLPGTPIDTFSGPCCPSRGLARREVCYSVCRQLQHLGELDSSLFPHPRTSSVFLGQDNEVEASVGPSYKRLYIPLSPDFWAISISRPPYPDFLYPCIISIVTPGTGIEERTPICILTRIPLPHLPCLQLFHFGNQLELNIHRVLPVKLEMSQLELVHRFTVKFCRIILNKPFESSSWKNMGYFLLPMKRSWIPPSETDQQPSYSFATDIDWHTVSLASETWAVPFTDLIDLRRELEDAVVQDRAVEFTYRCEINRIRNDMTPLSEIDDKPTGCSLLKYAAFAADERFENGGKTLLEQCHRRRKAFHGILEPNQPILEVTRISGATNCLNPRIPSYNSAPEKVIQRKLHLLMLCNILILLFSIDSGVQS